MPVHRSAPRQWPKARPDGGTPSCSAELPHVNEALLKAKAALRSEQDLDLSIPIAVGYVCFAVHPSIPAKTLDELVGTSEANPAKASYGHVGIGSTNLVGELLSPSPNFVVARPDVLRLAFATEPLIASTASSGGMKNSGSSQQSRAKRRLEDSRGVTSLRGNALPICAIPNGTFLTRTVEARS